MLGHISIGACVRSAAPGATRATVAIAVLWFAAGCGGRRGAASRTAQASALSVAVVSGNVERADYAGSEACQPCHEAVYASWERSPMHRMTRGGEAEVRAPFDGTRWRFKGDDVILERQGKDRFVRVESAGSPTRTYRVTRIIGGRAREDFAGVDVVDGGDEVVLPVSYVFATRALRYKGYSVMIHERAGLHAGPVWSRTCIFCHNTVPEVDRLLGPIAAPGARPYQGEWVDAWLPLDRRARVGITDAPAFALAVGAEVARLGGIPPGERASSKAVARAAIEVVRSRFDGGTLVEQGIGCEACHGGARSHARDPRVHPSAVPVSTWLRFLLPPAEPAAATNHLCARCHQVLFSRYPYTWEGGRRDTAAGGSHISSGEARDYLLGPCSSAMPCTDCHDPHGGPADAPRALATPAGNTTCTRCHQGLAGDDRLRSHAHHDPAGPGASCVGCHMARKNMGLDGVLTRYHRIGSPTDTARVLGDRPLECALCHADKSVGAVVESMESWWPVRYPRARLVELYGSLRANVMQATLERGKPHEQAVAIGTLGEARARDAVPRIAHELLNDYPLVREWAKGALASILGRCDVDLGADDATITQQAAACGLDGIPLERGPLAPGTLGRPPEDPED